MCYFCFYPIFLGDTLFYIYNYWVIFSILAIETTNISYKNVFKLCQHLDFKL